MVFSTSQMLFGYVCYYVNPLYLLLSVLYLFNLKYYIIHGDKETINNIIKKLTPHINVSYIKHSNGKDIPTGYFWSRKCIGWIDNNSHENDRVSIITSNLFYKDLVTQNDVTFTIEREDDEPVIHDNIKINVYMRSGHYKNLYYRSIKMNMNHIRPIGDQEPILNSMVDIYNRMGRATFFVHGVTYAGKSTLGYLLAKQLNGIYCHSFNPSEPGDKLSNLMVDVERDGEPLIIVLEEADIVIKSIHTGSVKLNPDIPTSVFNKASWSNFLDDMVFYNNVILVLTSNMSKGEIDKMDESYLRKGRINEYYSMQNKLNI
jgi:hypothetical protein